MCSNSNANANYSWQLITTTQNLKKSNQIKSNQAKYACINRLCTKQLQFSKYYCWHNNICL